MTRSPYTRRQPRRLPRRWSALLTAAALAAPLSLGSLPAAAAPEASPSFAGRSAHQIVVKVTSSYALGRVVADHPVTVQRALLRSRGIYLLQCDDPDADVDELATEIAEDYGVSYAEPNFTTSLVGDRFHSWPEGPPQDENTDPDSWREQPAAAALQLSDAHALTTGAGIRVAVLDTGVDLSHPALIGRTLSSYRGYDYVDDDSDVNDVREGVDSNGNGVVDDAYGHGTFVAGTIALVAPDARILPMRVLDSDGVGNVFVVAQAIMDAIDLKAKVINISFGTDQAMESHLLRDAIAQAQSRGIVVVAAAGNDASSAEHYPAADSGVLSVGALSGSTLSSWSNRGGWVRVAAPGDSVVGPIPDGEYASWSGTSMATPVVAGQVALVRARHPDWSTGAVTNAITSTSRPVSGVTDGAVDIVDSLR